jgi:hypothetical protein
MSLRNSYMVPKPRIYASFALHRCTILEEKFQPSAHLAINHSTDLQSRL